MSETPEPPPRHYGGRPGRRAPGTVCEWRGWRWRWAWSRWNALGPIEGGDVT